MERDGQGKGQKKAGINSGGAGDKSRLGKRGGRDAEVEGDLVSTCKGRADWRGVAWRGPGRATVFPLQAWRAPAPESLLSSSSPT